MRRLVILLALMGCSSASSSSGSLAPGQISADDPSAPREPNATATLPPSAPPPSVSTLPGCPSTRPIEKLPMTSLSSVDEFRTHLVGIYRSCSGAHIGMEMRLDPENPERILWWELDERFVRMNGSGMSGWFEPESCASGDCSVSWYTDTLGLASESTITMWNNPIAIEIAPEARSTSRSEWVRVAD